MSLSLFLRHSVDGGDAVAVGADLADVLALAAVTGDAAAASLAAASCPRVGREHALEIEGWRRSGGLLYLLARFFGGFLRGTSWFYGGFHRFGNSLDRLGAGLDRLNASLDRLNASLDRLRAGLGRLSASLGRLSASLGWLSASLGWLIASLGRLSLCFDEGDGATAENVVAAAVEDTVEVEWVGERVSLEWVDKEVLLERPEPLRTWSTEACGRQAYQDN